MKKAIHISTLFLLTGLILTSSLGISIYKMVCLESGNVVLSITKVQDCCADETEKSASDFSLEEECCAFSTSTITIDLLTFLKKQELKISSLSFYDVNSFFKKTSLGFQPIKKWTFSDLPPPLYGIKLLKFLSIFII